MGLRLFRVAQAGEAVLAVLQEDGEWHEATVEEVSATLPRMLVVRFRQWPKLQSTPATEVRRRCLEAARAMRMAKARAAYFGSISTDARGGDGDALRTVLTRMCGKLHSGELPGLSRSLVQSQRQR